MICQIGKDLKCKVGHPRCYGQCEENPEDILNDPNNDGEES
jgi:hypothetical protein